MVTLEEVDLTQADKHECPGINEAGPERDGDWYLAFVCGEFMVGKFSRQHYGLNFDCDWGASGVQFDAPGSNASSWMALWRIAGGEELLSAAAVARNARQALLDARDREEDD